MRHFLLMLLPLCQALSQDQGTLIMNSFIYSSYGILFLITAVSLVFYDRKGIFLGLIYWFTFMQFIVLVSNEQNLTNSSDTQIDFESFFKPLNLFDTPSTNFISNCLQEAILIITILIILTVRKFLPTAKRNLVDLVSIITYLTIQDFVYYSILNLKYFSTDGVLNYSGVSMSILYLLGLLFFICLLACTLKDNKDMSSFIKEDYENSEIYYFVLIFELILTAVFFALITDQYLIKISLVGALQIGVIIQVFISKKNSKLMKFIISISYHLTKLLICLLAILNYQDTLDDSYGQIAAFSLFFIGILVPVLRLFAQTNETIIAPYNIDKTVEIDHSERENKEMVDVIGKPEYKTERTANGEKEANNEDISEISMDEVRDKSPVFTITSAVIDDQVEPNIPAEPKRSTVPQRSTLPKKSTVPKRSTVPRIQAEPNIQVISNWINHEETPKVEMTPKAKKTKLRNLNEYTVRSYISK